MATSLAHVDMGNGTFVTVQREVLTDLSQVFNVKIAWYDIERELSDVSFMCACQDEDHAFRLFNELINCLKVAPK